MTRVLTYRSVTRHPCKCWQGDVLVTVPHHKNTFHNHMIYVDPSSYVNWLVDDDWFRLSARCPACAEMTIRYQWPDYDNHRLNRLRSEQNGLCLADGICEYIFLCKTFYISNKISLRFNPDSIIDNKWVLVQVMAWRWTGNDSSNKPTMNKFCDAQWGHKAKRVNLGIIQACWLDSMKPSFIHKHIRKFPLHKYGRTEGLNSRTAINTMPIYK